MSLSLLHSPADIVRWLMVDAGQASDPTLATLDDWPAYVDVETDTPDAVITVTDTTGQSDGRDMVDGSLNQHYGFQVRIRSVGKPDGFAKAQSLRRWMSEGAYRERLSVVPFGPATYTVHCFAKIGQVLSLGTDAPSSRRWLHTVNAMVTVSRVPPPTVYLQDDFDGTDGARIASRPMTVGPGWTIQDPAGDWVIDAGRARMVVTDSNVGAVAFSDAGVSDLVRETAVLRVPSGYPDSAIGLLARMSGDGREGWLAWMDVTEQTIKISERIANVFFLRATQPAMLDFNTNYPTVLTVADSTFTWVVGGAGCVSWTSPNYASNTRFGIYGNGIIPQSLSRFLVASL